MTVTLSTIRCPDSVPPERRVITGGEFTIGRAPDNDWVLPDPARHLSKRHCRLAYRSGGWQLTDLSTNGTFLNHASNPLGTANTAALGDGDRIRLGGYEIEVSVAADAQSFAGALGGRDAFDPFADDPPAPLAPPPERFEGGFGAQRDIRLPADFDPFAEEGFPASGAAHADHAPAIADAFRPPPPPAVAIPDDWDLDMPLVPRAAPAAATVPAASPPAPLPVASGATPLRPDASAAHAAPVAAEPTLVAAFLHGLGLADATIPDPARTLELAGAALRATVAGIRETLIARAAVKGEFRIEQTMIRAAGNNPLKFSAGDEDALLAVLGIGRRNMMSGADAVSESLADMRMHELATMHAMQEAVRALLARLDPAPLEEAAEKGGLSMIPGGRKARAFDAYAALYGRVRDALSDDFDSVFGKSFARAYEESMRELARRGGGA